MADHKHPISGPGASDFIGAPGGEDRPGVSPNKGTTSVRRDSELDDTRNLDPTLAPEMDEEKPEE